MEIIQKLRVVELASVLAGPSVGQFFAELGAEVIKIENKNGGDVTRSWRLSTETTDDRSAYFCSVNWGKKSVAMDLTDNDDRTLLYKLIKKSDIVIASYKPGDAVKLGVDYATLAAMNERLLYGQISGYGTHNPRVGYDAVIQAESGFMFMNGHPDGPSLKMPVALVDVLAGHQLKEGLLLALLERIQTGRGKLVEVSLLQAAIASLVNQASNYLVAGHIPQKQGSSHPNIAPYGDVFLTKDDKQIILAVGNDHQFRRLCMILEIDVNSINETNTARVRNRHDLNAVLAQQINKLLCDDLLTQLHAHKIPAGVIQNMEEVFALDSVNELLLRADGLRGVRSFVASHHRQSIIAPPHLGEHTNEVLHGLRRED